LAATPESAETVVKLVEFERQLADLALTDLAVVLALLRKLAELVLKKYQCLELA
jgi:hypothetical protein